MKKMFQRTAVLSLAILVLFATQQSLCMENEESERLITPRLIFSPQGDDNILSALTFLKNVKVASEEDSAKIQQSVEKIEELIAFNFSLQKTLIKKEKKIASFKKERKKLYSLTAASGLRAESCVSLTEGTMTSPASPLSFDEWRQKISTKTASWSETLLKKCASQPLKSLDFRGNFLRTEGVHALCLGDLSSLTTLDLKENFIGDIGIKAFVNCDLCCLTSLYLEDNYITDDGVETIVFCKLPFLVSLTLRKNFIKDRGAKLISSANLLFLTTLDLIGNYIEDAGAIALTSSSTLPALQTLHLQSNQVSYEVQNNIKSSSIQKIRSLHL